MSIALKRPLLVLVAAALTVAGVAGEDATYLVEDTVGDANGVNPQGLGGLVPALPNDQSTPVDVAEYDIVGVRYATLYETVEVDGETTHVITGVESRMGLSAQPTPTSPPAIVRFTQEANGCRMFLQYYGGTNGVRDHDTGSIRITCEGDLTGGNPPPVPEGAGLDVHWDEETSEVVWAFTFGTGTAADTYLNRSSTLVPGNPHVRVDSGVITAPVIDEMYNPTSASFTVGQDVPTD